MGNCLFLRARGWGIDRQMKKKLQIPGGMPGGGMVTGRIEPCIISKTATEITQHLFDMKARGTRLNCLNTFGHSKTPTNLSVSSGELLSSVDLTITLTTNVIYVFLKNL